MLKKLLCIGMAVISSVCLFAGCGEDNTDEFVLKIGYNNSLCEAPLQMGVEKGFFAEET